MSALELTEILEFDGRLTVREYGFALTYYFPGPDRRYNGTILQIDDYRLREYIAGWSENWHAHQTLRASIFPITFTAEGKLGMTLDGRGVWLHTLRVTSDEELKLMLAALKHAQIRGAELQGVILAQLGQTHILFSEKLERFRRFRAGEFLGLCINPAVVLQLDRALELVRVESQKEVDGCDFRVSEGLEGPAVHDLMEDLRRHGLDVFFEQQRFRITWLNRS